MRHMSSAVINSIWDSSNKFLIVNMMVMGYNINKMKKYRLVIFRTSTQVRLMCQFMDALKSKVKKLKLDKLYVNVLANYEQQRVIN